MLRPLDSVSPSIYILYMYIFIIYMSTFLYQESRHTNLSQNNEVYTINGL